MKKVRWGVIGAGGIANLRTIPGMMLCENAELEAVMDISMELAQKEREKWNCPKAYDTVESLLDDSDIDAVYIATPVFLHAAQAKAAADAGKHILIEKPIAATSEEAQEIVEYCKKKNVLIAVGFMMRFGTIAQKMKQIIADGKIGNPVSGYSQFVCYYPEIPNCWRQKKSSGGGGAMMDMGVHGLDLIQYVVGMRATELCAMHGTISFNYEVEDTSTVVLRMENGMQCVVQSNFNIPYEAGKSCIEIMGEKGSVIASGIIGQVDGGALETRVSSGDDNNSCVVERIDNNFGNMYTREITSFSDSILHGTPVEVPAEEGIYIQRIMENAYRSNDTGKIIKL